MDTLDSCPFCAACLLPPVHSRVCTTTTHKCRNGNQWVDFRHRRKPSTPPPTSPVANHIKQSDQNAAVLKFDFRVSLSLPAGVFETSYRDGRPETDQRRGRVVGRGSDCQLEGGASKKNVHNVNVVGRSKR
ncbi:CpaE2 pilus assembly protein [Anopheles sinensis]|uniref:CpaE2 pilus assembly protein n=1 Tax=Anopheles sinensis TaxID=74873 RepID=A0A084WGD1_ANOSI|nr:CpaE2 pilus assembly protein [Anopheles sinensis]